MMFPVNVRFKFDFFSRVKVVPDFEQYPHPSQSLPHRPSNDSNAVDFKTFDDVAGRQICRSHSLRHPREFIDEW